MLIAHNENHKSRRVSAPTIACRFKMPRSAGRLWTPSVLRHPPVDAFEQGVQSTPRAEADVPMPADVQVIDPTHPLYGRRFQLVSVIRGTCSDSRVRVKWRFGLTLLLSLEVTNLVPRNEQRTTPTKLSIEAIQDLLVVAGGSEGACPSTLKMSGATYRRRSAGRSSKISRSVLQEMSHELGTRHLRPISIAMP